MVYAPKMPRSENSASACENVTLSFAQVFASWFSGQTHWQWR